MFQYFRLQFCCLMIMLLVGTVYDVGTRRRGKEKQFCNPIFDALILLGDFEIILDGLSAVTVNYLSSVPRLVNLIIHGVFFISLLTEIFLYFIYILKETSTYPAKKNILAKVLIYVPFFLVVAGILFSLKDLEFLIGVKTNYSMGLAVYLCFGFVAILLFSTILVVIKNWKYISKSKRYNIGFFLILVTCFSVCQIIIPEALLTSAGVLLLVIGIYLTLENPLYREIADSTNEMVTGFATLVENRDDNTGGHIIRTSAYVELLAKEMRKRKIHKKQLNSDYISAIKQAAPMHDVGKIAIPDSILQKPGRLTAEEFEIMKKHSALGSDIILKTFGKTGSKEFSAMAYDVARYHHEKWNGRGYPEGLAGEKIPLSARIMAVADVFDAVTEKRCYKEALPLEESFKIIENGAGTDFDPEIVKVFLELKKEITQIHNQFIPNN